MSRLERDIEMRKLDKSKYDLSKRYTFYKNAEIAASVVTLAAFIGAFYEEYQQDISAYPFLLVGITALIGASSFDALKKDVQRDVQKKEDALAKLERENTFGPLQGSIPREEIYVFNNGLSNELLTHLDVRGTLDVISSSGGYYNGPYIRDNYTEVVIKKD